jgi:hypothetical protein
MSFNRIKYDKSAYELQMSRSTNPGDYRLHSDFAENCSQCISVTGPVGSKSDVSIVKDSGLSFEQMTDVESNLSWRNKILSKSNDNSSLELKVNTNNKPTCNMFLTSEDTRFTNPIDNYRCMSLTDYMVDPYLSVNPQCHIQTIPERTGLNSRLFTKDNYRMPKQEYLDTGSALPTEIPSEKQICNV